MAWLGNADHMVLLLEASKKVTGVGHLQIALLVVGGLSADNFIDDFVAQSPDLATVLQTGVLEDLKGSISGLLADHVERKALLQEVIEVF